MLETHSNTDKISSSYYCRESLDKRQACPKCSKKVRELDYKSGLCERCHLKAFARHIMEKGNHVVYCQLKHVSQSGMSRAISFMTIIDNEPFSLDRLIADLCDYNFNKKHGGLTVSGCGMDMGFDTVYNFSLTIYHEAGEKYDYDKAFTLKHHWL